MVAGIVVKQLAGDRDWHLITEPAERRPLPLGVHLLINLGVGNSPAGLLLLVSQAKGQGGHLEPRARPGLAQQVGHVGADRLVGDKQRRRDLGIGTAGHEMVETSRSRLVSWASGPVDGARAWSVEPGSVSEMRQW